MTTIPSATPSVRADPLTTLPGYDADAAVLELAGLQIEFGDRDGRIRVVDGVDCAVAAGETLAVVGESGCGKSITARAVMGILPPGAGIAAGAIRLHGVDLLGLDRRRRRRLRGDRIAMIFQDALSALNPVLPVGYQIAEVFRVHRRMSRREAHRKAIEMLERVRIPAAARRVRDHPHQFSGGMRQRVMIAVALALNPDVLIADEPTTALDVTVQAQIMELLADLQAEHGIGLLLITHDMGVVADVADRVMVMYAGRVVERAPARDLCTAPAHPYTRALLNAIPGRGSRGRPLAVPPRRATRSREPARRVRVAAAVPAGGRVLRDGPATVRGGAWTLQRLPPLDGGDHRMNSQSVVLNARDLVRHIPVAHGGLFRRSSGSVRAVDGVNLELRRSETLGVVGESGSGKSTLARLLTAVDHPTSGEISVLGERIDHMRGRQLQRARRHIKLVFQDPYTSLDPRMTAEAIVREPLLIHRDAAPRGEHRRLVRELLEPTPMTCTRTLLRMKRDDVWVGQVVRRATRVPGSSPLATGWRAVPAVGVSPTAARSATTASGRCR